MVTGQDGNLLWPAPTLKVTWFLDHLFMRDHVSSYNYYIFFVLVPMTTKRGRMVTYLEELIAIKSLKHFNFVRSRDKLKPLYLHYKSTSCHQTWCEGDIPGEAPNNKVTLITSSCKVTSCKSPYISTTRDSMRIWQDDDLPWWVPTYKFIWPFDQVALKDHVTN